MPAAFEKCIKAGGRVRTIVPKKGTYLHICYPKGGGPSVSGEVKKNQLSEVMNSGKPTS
jgi:hypothetical protein